MPPETPGLMEHYAQDWLVHHRKLGALVLGLGLAALGIRVLMIREMAADGVARASRSSS